MQDDVRFAVVGLRNVGQRHVRQVIETQCAKLVAVADTDPDRVAEVCAKYDVESGHGDADEVFARDDVDAVVLALPNHLHAPLSIKALEAGKHVLVEKPIAVTSDEARGMIEARDRAGRLLMPGMNLRLKPALAALRREIEADRIGTPYLAHATYNQVQPSEKFWQRGDWFLTGERSGGGPLIDLGIHALDQALFLTGFPSVVRVSGYTYEGIGKRVAQNFGKRYELEDGGGAVLHTDSGVTIYLEASYFMNRPTITPPGVELAGTRGAINGGALYTLNGSELAEAEFEIDPEADRHPVEHLARAVRGDQPLTVTAEQGFEALRVIEAVYESARSGAEVVLHESAAAAGAGAG